MTFRANFEDRTQRREVSILDSVKLRIGADRSRAIVNKRAGGSGLISGRKAFQRPFAEGVELLHTSQDVYLDPTITIT